MIAVSHLSVAVGAVAYLRRKGNSKGIKRLSFPVYHPAPKRQLQRLMHHSEIKALDRSRRDIARNLPEHFFQVATNRPPEFVGVGVDHPVGAVI